MSTNALIALMLACCLLSLGCTGANQAQPNEQAYKPQNRTYFIAAENVLWNYAPNLTGLAVSGNPWLNQTVYKKVRYIEYTDGTFTVKKPQPVWLGILGPIIRGVPGDTITVVFYNKADLPYSMHPHGLRYDKSDEGSMPMESMGMAAIANQSPPAAMPGTNGSQSMQAAGGTLAPSSEVYPGDEVMPGQKYTYAWNVTNESGPGAGEGSTKLWFYHSHVDAVTDVYDGLIGPIIITAPAYAKEDATPIGVDKEFVALFMIFDESASHLHLDALEGNKKDAINGYIFNNLGGLTMNKGDKVKWYIIGMGNEADLHTPHWHGETVSVDGTHTDVVEVLPATTVTADMDAENVGIWAFHCHVADHMTAGMMAVYTIKG